MPAGFSQVAPLPLVFMRRNVNVVMLEKRAEPVAGRRLMYRRLDVYWVSEVKFVVVWDLKK